MDEIGALQTLSEASITFTGLAGLVSVLGSSSLPPHVRAWRVQNMILCSLLAFFCTLIPQGLLLYGLPVESVWTLTSGVLLASQIAQVIFAAMAINDPSVDLYRPYWLTAAFVTGTAMVLYAHLFNLMPEWGEPSASPVFLGIAWLMVIATMHFFVLVMSRDRRISADGTLLRTLPPGEERRNADARVDATEQRQPGGTDA